PKCRRLRRTTKWCFRLKKFPGSGIGTEVPAELPRRKVGVESLHFAALAVRVDGAVITADVFRQDSCLPQGGERVIELEGQALIGMRRFVAAARRRRRRRL